MNVRIVSQIFIIALACEYSKQNVALAEPNRHHSSTKETKHLNPVNYIHSKNGIQREPRPEQITVSGSPIVHNMDQVTRQLQRIPQAATHIDAAELKAEHMNSLPDAARLLPSVQLNTSNPRNTSINIRGLGGSGTLPTDGIEGGVGIYVDDVYLSRPGTALSSLPDLNGITVLRGPTGTEGGMVTTAGSISLTTQAPDLRKLKVYGEAGVGNFDYNRWALGTSVPIIKDKLAIRLSALGYSNSGWVKNVIGGGDMMGQVNRTFRASILYKPTDEVSIRIIGDYSHLHINNNSADGLYKTINTTDNGHALSGTLAQRASWMGYTPLSPSDKPYKTALNTPSNSAQEDMGLSSHIEWAHNNMKFKSITAYRWWNWSPNNDGDLQPVSALLDGSLAVNQNQFTQEFRFENKWRNFLSYNVGAFYMWQENRTFSQSRWGSDAARWMGYGSTTVGPSEEQASNVLNGLGVFGRGQPTTNYYATYANAVWKITNKFDIITGIRYNYSAKNGSFSQNVSLPSTYNPAVISPAAAQGIWSNVGSNTAYGAHMDNGFVTSQVVLRYHINPNTMIYGRYARGGKSGGLNLTAFSANQLQSGAVSPNVAKETDDSYEVGLKNSLLHGRLLSGISVYQTNDYNYQVTAVHNYQGSLLSYLSSAPLVRIRGAEFDLHYSPIDNFITSISGSYTDAQFLKYQTSAPPEVYSASPYNLAHTSIPFVPKWSVSVSVQYSHTLGTMFRNKIDGFLGGSYHYNSRENTTANNSRYGWVSGYGTLNLNFGVKTHDGRWELGGFVNNATNERHITQIAQGAALQGNGSYYAYVTQPLNFGFIAKVNY